MTQGSLNYQVTVSALSLIAQEGRLGHLNNVGLSAEDFNKLVSPIPWLNSDRNRVTSALHIMLSSPLDAQGISRFNLPAEYVAAAIGLLVAPNNIKLACRWVERPMPAGELGQGIEEIEKCTAQQLFALIVQFHGGNEWCLARQQFEKNTKLKLQQLEEQGGSNEGKKNIQK